MLLDVDLSCSRCSPITRVSSGIWRKNIRLFCPWISLQLLLSDYIEPAFECKRSWWQYPAAATCFSLAFWIWHHVPSFSPGLRMPASEHLKTSEQQSLIAVLDSLIMHYNILSAQTITDSICFQLKQGFCRTHAFALGDVHDQSEGQGWTWTRYWEFIHWHAT